MMEIHVKNLADNGDLKSLKYIFADSLDVDPTFARYEEEYCYCKSIPGLLEEHVELTPFRQNPSAWDDAYWTQLKMDLVKNFSDRRMMHMKDVAQVYLAEKITRLLKERSATVAEAVDVANRKMPEVKKVPECTIQTTPAISRSELQNRALEEMQRKLEEDNRRTEAARQAEAKRIEQQKQKFQAAAQTGPAGDWQKKAIGIAFAVLMAAAVILILLLK